MLFQVLHRRLHILYKAELSKLPLLGRVFILGGFVPVERDNREAAMASIARGAQSLRAGNSFLIFPEGTRSRTRQLLPFKKGGFIMALQAQAPIVPVAINGGRAAMRKGSKLVWPTTVTVTIGPPIETAGMTVDDRDALIASVRAAFSACSTETSLARDDELLSRHGNTGLPGPHARLLVCGRHQPLRDRRPHRPGVALRVGRAAGRYAMFDNDWVIGTAIVLYVVEFFADKVPWIDTLWDSVHTFIRPLGGALVAVAGLGDASPATQGMVALLGGAVAAGSHVTKAGTRVVANTSPEPVSNWLLSLFEDALVVALWALALKYPLAALAVTVLLVAAIVMLFVDHRPRVPPPLRDVIDSALPCHCAASARRTRETSILLASRRRPGAVAFGCVLAGAAAIRGQAPTPPPQDPQRPTFRLDANFVRVDIYPDR